jgi:uncharacterized repeat protein (TIGR01451 family)
MFVVEWNDNQHYSSSTSGVTFEAILYEGTNNIKFQYKDVDFGTVSGAVGGDNPPYNNGGSATVGIENPTGIIGLQYSFNNAVITPGLAILFKFPQFRGTNLFLSKQAPVSMDRGSSMTYTVHYHNFGDTTAQNVILVDTLPNEVEFLSASDNGNYNAATRKVTWDIGSLTPSGHGSATVTVGILQSTPIGNIIQNDATISTSNVEVRLDDNEAHTQTLVTGSNLPPDVGVEPNNGGSTPSVYWNTPITFSYYNPTAVSVGINIHINDGGPDIIGTMSGGPPDWTFITTFYPRHGTATITYTVNDPTPYTAGFDTRNMRCFEHTITAAEIVTYIQETYPTSPMLSETDIGHRFINAGLEHQVNPAFLVATAQHEGNFGTGGWAASHPNAHNTMGWGIYPGHMDEDWEGNDRNAFNNWGDGIEHVASRIAAEDGYYYGQGHYTVSEIREVYAGDPATQTIVNYMNDLAESAGQAGNFNENFNIYIDPAGYIYDITTGNRISGANVWLQRPDGTGDWENVPTGQTPALMIPDINPQITGNDGQYQWDVLEGSYRVHVEAFGYYPANSSVVSIPPLVTDLHVGLTPIVNFDSNSPATIKTIGNPKYGGNDEWVTSSTEFNLTATDDLSGVDTMYYRIWISGVWTLWLEYIDNFTLFGEGKHYLEYYSVDNAGNVESTHNQTHYVDDSGPVVTISASPNSLWPPNHKMKNVVISGSVTDAGSGIASVTFAVVDEYGQVEPTITHFSQTIQLEAWRNGNDMDGRMYTITATATDNLGHITTASTVVLVPHDQGN